MEAINEFLASDEVWLLVAVLVAGVFLLAAKHPATVTAASRLNDAPISKGPEHYAVVATPLALALLAYQPAAVFAEGPARGLLILPIPLLAVLILLQIRAVAWPAFWLTALAGIYTYSTLGEDDSSRGVVHTISLISVGVAFLTFAIYGRAMLAYPLTRWLIAGIALLGMAALYLEDGAKNAAGGTVIYLVALIMVAFLRKRGGLAALTFAAIGVVVAFELDFRAMIGYSALFLFFYAAAGRRSYRVVGIASVSAILGAVMWFFLNIKTSPLAIDISRRIAGLTGRRSESGRDELWPHVLQAAQDSPWFGLGAGTLPRDLLATSFSSHNYYIQLFIQVGFIGLAVLILFLITVWNRLYTARTPAARFGSALFLMFIVHNGTEVIMFQNLISAAVPAWCAIGLAVALNYTQPSSGTLTASGDDTLDSKLPVPHSGLAMNNGFRSR